jgi:hypothetical protein
MFLAQTANPLLKETISKIISIGPQKQGIFCVNSILNSSTIEDLASFAQTQGIFIPPGEDDRLEIIRRIYLFFYEKYVATGELKKKYDSPQEYIGSMVIPHALFAKYLSVADFTAKQDLIDVFADYCADMGISVFDSSNVADFGLDLYLTKRKPLLKTESVFVETGEELREVYGSEFLGQIQNSSRIATWTILVTTPLGVYYVGLDRLVKEMTQAGVWLYVIDPLTKRVLGITKGKDSKYKDDELRDAYIRQLPAQPIRAPSQVVKISKYAFEERKSYNPKDFRLYNACEENLYTLPSDEVPRYRDIFRYLLVIDQENGLPLLSLGGEVGNVDETLISGFLSAMETFVSGIGATGALSDIEYKGLFVHGTQGTQIKTAIFLSQRADKSLDQRITLFLKKFEQIYADQINEYRDTGKLNVFNKEEVFNLAKEILAI